MSKSWRNCKLRIQWTSGKSSDTDGNCCKVLADGDVAVYLADRGADWRNLAKSPSGPHHLKHAFRMIPDQSTKKRRSFEAHQVPSTAVQLGANVQYKQKLSKGTWLGQMQLAPPQNEYGLVTYDGLNVTHMPSCELKITDKV